MPSGSRTGSPSCCWRPSLRTRIGRTRPSSRHSADRGSSSIRPGRRRIAADPMEDAAVDAKPSLGLIGLGIMGRPMARNLLAAGYRLTVHDVSRAAVEELVANGATEGTSARQVAASTDVLITMLPDSPQVREVYLGRDGAFEALRPGWLAIDMSSIAPSTAR